jgi:phosphatidate phosphatase PAH1
VHSRGYKVLYFTSSPLPPQGVSLPSGPILRSPLSLVCKTVERSEVFKAAALRGLRTLFPTHCAPFYAGLCARESDAAMLARSGAASGRCFIVTRGLVRAVGHTYSRPCGQLAAEIDCIFPRCSTSFKELKSRLHSPDSDYSDFGFWRAKPQPLY